MAKKASVVALGVAAAVFVLYCTTVGSYFRTACKQWGEAAGRQVPIDLRIQNLKDEVAQLDPEIDRNRSIVAEEIVAVEKLNAKVEGARKELKLRREQLDQLATSLETSQATITYAGQKLSPDQAAARLKQDLDITKHFARALESEERQLAARKRMLDTSKEKLQAMTSVKAKLLARIAEVEASYQELQLQATQSRVQFDDSRLARIKKSLEDLDDRVKVEKVKLDLAGGEPGAAPTAEQSKTREEIVRETKQFLNGDKEEVTADRK